MYLVQDRQGRRPPNDNSLRQLRPPKEQEAHLPSPGVYAAIPRKTSEEAARSSLSHPHQWFIRHILKFTVE